MEEDGGGVQSQWSSMPQIHKGCRWTSVSVAFVNRPVFIRGPDVSEESLIDGWRDEEMDGCMDGCMVDT